jgi:hypothetical protein
MSMRTDAGPAERAAHLVDHVFPDVPVRQWVLTLPHRLRYLLAWDHALCRAVMAVFMRAVLGFLRRRARVEAGVADGRSGAVVIVQRFGAPLNVNVMGMPSCSMACSRRRGLARSAFTPRRHHPMMRWNGSWRRSSGGYAGC